MHSYILMCMHTRTYILRFARAREERGGVFVGYSWGIHGVYICIGYVSGMCRVCIGYVSEHTRCEGGCTIKFRADICRFQKKAVPLWGILNREAESENREAGVGNQESKIKN